jgi:hypothetical protein
MTRALVTRVLPGLLSALVLAVPVLTGCNAGSEETKAVQHTFDRLDKLSDLRASKPEVLSRLSTAGLDPKVMPVERMDSRMAEILDHMPQKPLDRFLLGVDGEGMIALEFPNTDLARWAEREDHNGFRYRNWYFHGAVTVEVTRRMQAALQG